MIGYEHLDSGKEKMDEFDVLLITHNHLEITINCLNALYTNTTVPFRLTVIDDSTDLTPAFLRCFAKEHNNVNIIRPRKKITHHAQLWNLGLKNTELEYIVFMVNSATVEPQWADVALDLIKTHPKIGIVGFKTLRPNGLIECAGVMLCNGKAGNIGLNEPGHHHTYVSQVDAVPGAVVLIRRSAIADGFDEKAYIGFGGFDDIDMCLAMRERGWDVVYCGFGAVYHQGAATRSADPQFWDKFNENKRRFDERWEALLNRQIPKK